MTPPPFSPSCHQTLDRLAWCSNQLQQTSACPAMCGSHALCAASGLKLLLCAQHICCFCRAGRSNLCLPFQSKEEGLGSLMRVLPAPPAPADAGGAGRIPIGETTPFSLLLTGRHRLLQVQETTTSSMTTGVLICCLAKTECLHEPGPLEPAAWCSLTPAACAKRICRQPYLCCFSCAAESSCARVPCRSQGLLRGSQRRLSNP